MAIARRKTKSNNTKVTQVEQNTISSVYHSELEQFIKRKQQKQHKTASKSWHVNMNDDRQWLAVRMNQTSIEQQ